MAVYQSLRIKKSIEEFQKSFGENQTILKNPLKSPIKVFKRILQKSSKNIFKSQIISKNPQYSVKVSMNPRRVINLSKLP